jgi:hypothetical protein
MQSFLFIYFFFVDESFFSLSRREKKEENIFKKFVEGGPVESRSDYIRKWKEQNVQ